MALGISKRMSELKGAHKEQTAWIVGKGPSLQSIEETHIGEGPVITLNQAIVPVESLKIKNDVYSMQKDGGELRGPEWRDKPVPGWYSDPCKLAGIKCNECPGMVKPKKATLLLYERASNYCFPNYEDRVIFDVLELGMESNECSLGVALWIAKFFGCKKAMILCCDAHATGNYYAYNPESKEIEPEKEDYFFQTRALRKHFSIIDHEFITPGREV